MDRILHSSRRLSVFLVGTEFFRSYGGIQYINRLLVRAFCELARNTPLDLEVFSFADGPEHFPSAREGDCAVRWHGASRRRGEMAWQLTRRLASTRPDLVLFTHVSLLPLEEMVRALAPRARVAALAHGTEVWRPLEGMAARVLPRVDSFACPSAFTAQKLAEVQGIHPSRVTVIPHGLDPDWTEEGKAGAEMYERPARAARQLLSVTRLSRADREGKGIELVLQALPAVVDRCPGVRYMVVGGGGDLPRMAEMVRQLGLESRTELTGARREDGLRQAYAAADIFVLPTQVEGFGVVFLEAMYHRLPVVAVRASATPEVVEDGVTGLLVSPGDSGELSAALIALLSDDERRRAMGEAGRQRVERLYRFEHFAGRWERWLAAQVPEALYAARQSCAFQVASAAAGAT
ncbi:MAG TPA: glycosyltransferase family 4 protein [Candidatus Acidoferrales bacterium]|nr:glycosyltransferase family 4 protein [Candidatus Acidoferrales bacterium]